MRWLARWIRRRAADEDFDREVQFHLNEEARLFIERGADPESARRAARRLFGNVALVKDATRRVSGLEAVRMFVTDGRDVFRSLTRHPALTLAAVVTFALGIGANVAVFAMFDRLLFRPLPYLEPDRLVHFHSLVSRAPNPRALRNGVTDAAFLPTRVINALGEETDSFSGVAWAEGVMDITPPDENPLLLSSVSRTLVEVLGLRLSLGHTFAEVSGDGSRDAAEMLVLLTYDAWRGRYLGSPDVLNRSWKSGQAIYRIIGVLPEGFLLPTSRLNAERCDGIMTAVVPFLRSAQRGGHTVAPFARLKPGVSVEQAQARVDALVSGEFADEPWPGTQGRGRKVIVQPLQYGIAVVVGPYLWFVVGAVWAVLAVTCFSLATLLLTWGQSRQVDAGVRLALGASPVRLLGTALLESCAICLAGAAVAWLGYVWARTALIEVVPAALHPFAVEPTDLRLVAALIGVSTVVAALAGAVPAFRAYRADVLTVLRPDRTSSHVRLIRGASGLVALQSAFGLVLVVGAAATIPAFAALVWSSPGFDADDMYVADVRHNWAQDEAGALLSTPQGIARVRMATEAIAGVPGVVVAAPTTATTLTSGLAGLGEFWKALGITGHQSGVGNTFFQAFGVSMRAGRAFDEGEVASKALVAVINEAAVRTLWPGTSPADAVGRTVQTADGSRQVVGVVSDFRSHPVVPLAPALFIPITATEIGPRSTNLSFVVRMSPGRVPDRSQFEARLNERFPPNRVLVGSVNDAVLPERIQPRFLAVLFGALAATSLVLVAAGLYGLMSFEVAARRRELSIRLALGATARDLRRRLLIVLITPVVVGAIAGGLAAWWAGSAVATTISNLNVQDPRMYAGGFAIMLSVASAAALWPARRLSKMRPADILKLS